MTFPHQNALNYSHPRSEPLELLARPGALSLWDATPSTRVPVNLLLPRGLRRTYPMLSTEDVICGEGLCCPL